MLHRPAQHHVFYLLLHILLIHTNPYTINYIRIDTPNVLGATRVVTFSGASRALPKFEYSTHLPTQN